MRLKSQLTWSLFPKEELARATVASRQVVNRKGERVQDPPLVQRLLNDPRAGWIWVLPRIWLGYQWFSAALHKVGNPAWVETGADYFLLRWIGTPWRTVPVETDRPARD